jgi:hypothetical protein
VTEYRYFLVMTFGKWRRRRLSALVRRWGPAGLEQEEWFQPFDKWESSDTLWESLQRREHVEKPITARQAARQEERFTRSFRTLQRRIQGRNPAAPDALFPPDMKITIKLAERED